MTWTYSTAKKASPWTLWSELGLHRGFIAERTITRRGSSKDSLEVALSFYNLGESETVGVCDGFCRFVLHKSNATREEWFDEWDQSDKDGELEGPVVCPHSSNTASNHTRENADLVLRLLRNGSGKPVLKSGGKPKLRAKEPPFKIKPNKPSLAVHKPNTKFTIKGK